AVARLAGAEQVAGLSEGNLDGPPPGVPRDQVCGGGSEVCGDQSQVVAGVGGVVAQQDDPDGLGVEGPVPQAGALSDQYSVGATVALDLCGCELCSGGEVGWCAQPVAFECGTAAFAGGR